MLGDPNHGVARVSAGQEPVGTVHGDGIGAQAVTRGPGEVLERNGLVARDQLAFHIGRRDLLLLRDRARGDCSRIVKIAEIFRRFAAQALEFVFLVAGRNLNFGCGASLCRLGGGLRNGGEIDGVLKTVGYQLDF